MSESTFQEQISAKICIQDNSQNNGNYLNQLNQKDNSSSNDGKTDDNSKPNTVKSKTCFKIVFYLF